MAPFPCPSRLLSNPELPSTPNRCTAAAVNSLPFRPLSLGTRLLRSPRSLSRSRRVSGSPCNPAPIASFSGVPSPMLLNFLHQSRQVPLQSWISSRRHAPLLALVTVCVLPMEHALVQPASLVLRVNRVRRVSSVLNASPVHPTVPSATRESQVPASVLPPPLPTHHHPAIVSTVFAVPMDSVHATLAGPLVPMVPRVRRVQPASSRPTTVTAKVGSCL